MSSLPAWRDALQQVLAAADALPCETVDTAACSGRVLAVSVHAPWDLPQAAVSTMDGWAVRAADVDTDDPVLAIAGESAAGRPSDRALRPRHAIRISTGAVLP